MAERTIKRPRQAKRIEGLSERIANSVSDRGVRGKANPREDRFIFKVRKFNKLQIRCEMQGYQHAYGTRLATFRPSTTKSKVKTGKGKGSMKSRRMVRMHPRCDGWHRLAHVVRHRSDADNAYLVYGAMTY